MSIKRFIAFILLHPKRLFCTLYNFFRHICENSYTIRICVFFPRMQKHLVYPIFSIPLFSGKKTKSAFKPTPFSCFLQYVLRFLLAAATVAATAATERNKNRNNVAATRTAALETVASAKEQQQDYPQAIATAGHSAFVKIVHISTSRIVKTRLISSR